MSCYLNIVYRKHYVFYRTLYNCTNQIHQALQHTLFRVFLIQVKPLCDAFLDLFSNLFSLVFFLNCGYLFCLTCKNKKNYERAESEEAKKTKKKTIFNSKKGFVRVRSFMTSAKRLKLNPNPPFPLYA